MTEQLQIGCPDYLRTWPQVSALLESFRLEAPSVRVTLKSGLGGSLLQELADGSLDLAVVLGPVASPVLATVTLSRERLMVVLPSTSPLADVRTVQADQLEGLPLVLFPRQASPALYDHYVGVLARAGVRPTVTEEPTREGTREAAAAGLGFTLAAATLARRSPVQGAVHRPLAADVATVDLNLAWRPDASSTPARQLVTVAERLSLKYERQGRDGGS